jgi:hypothetical protein
MLLSHPLLLISAIVTAVPLSWLLSKLFSKWYHGAFLSCTRHNAHFYYRDFTSVNLSERSLRNSVFVNVNLSHSNLSNSDASWAKFNNVDLTAASLARCNLSFAKLKGSTLIGANLFKANCSYANFSGVDLTDANLEGANLSGAKNFHLTKGYLSIVVNENTIPPDKWTVFNGRITPQWTAEIEEYLCDGTNDELAETLFYQHYTDTTVFDMKSLVAALENMSPLSASSPQ